MTEVTELTAPAGATPNTQEVLLNLGPQHPSTHGVLRLVLEMDGEIVERVDPHIGYLHRGTEKLAESFTYTQIFPLTDRLDYLCPPSNNLAFALAVEKLLDIEAPERAQYIRVLMAELARLSGHLLITGALPMDLGAMTALLYAMREREMIMDLMEMITGARMHTSFCRVGGVREDLTDEHIARIREFCAIFPNRIRDYERLLDKNRVFLKRTRGIGVITPEDGDRPRPQRPEPARLGRRLGYPPRRALRDLRPAGLQRHHPRRGRLLRPLAVPRRRDAREREASSSSASTRCPTGRSRSTCPRSPSRWTRTGSTARWRR